jgi:hypothetical protein
MKMNMIGIRNATSVKEGRNRATKGTEVAAGTGFACSTPANMGVSRTSTACEPEDDGISMTISVNELPHRCDGVQIAVQAPGRALDESHVVYA